MNNKHQLAKFKQQLLSMQTTLLEDVERGESATQVVELDQSSVGRLSRMDAMQVQAMAQENARRRVLKLQQIDVALNRIARDDYGYCTDCDVAIALKRLEFDPTVTLCIECASSNEQSI